MHAKDLLLIEEAARYLGGLVQQHQGSMMLVMALPEGKGVVCPIMLEGDAFTLGQGLAHYQAKAGIRHQEMIKTIISQYLKN